MHTRLSTLWPPLALLGLTLFFFHGLAFTDHILARGDTYAYFYPYWHARNSALLAGQLPLWTPDLFMGAPLLANSQLGTFYPLNWPLAPLSPPDGIRISILLHVYLALVGTYLLACAVLPHTSGWRGTLPPLAAAVIFGLGGYLSAHIEQINQLQGLAWLPWLFLLYRRAQRAPGHFIPLLAAIIALQFFTGHTQTVFIGLVGLAVYGLTEVIPLVLVPSSISASEGQRLRPWKIMITRALLMVHPLLILATAAFIGLMLAAPQLIPTMELNSLSNRRGGLNPNEATAFSLNPLLIGRGMLPSYDSFVFAEYIAYAGVIGLGLALVGLFTRGRNQPPRAPWLALGVAGLFLALGEFNPLYWPLAGLPGFNFFRVPARWLALYALGGALLAGMGLQALLAAPPLRRWRLYSAVIAVTGGLAVASLLAIYAPQEVMGPAAPTSITWAGWGVALMVLLAGLALWRRISTPLLVGALVAELFLAAAILPYNLLVTPDTYTLPRFTTYQLHVYQQTQTPPGRILSISGLFFDPGDKATLGARYHHYGLSEQEIRLALVDTKMKEVLAANLPLIYGIPTIDGFDGGLLPTAHYTAFTSLLLPNGNMRTVDGRLREILAKPGCRGACMPPARWLNLTNTRYLITDKVYDLWHEGVAYDTQFTIPLAVEADYTLGRLPGFEANALDVLYSTGHDTAPLLQVIISHSEDPAETALEDSDQGTLIESFTRARFMLDAAVTPQHIRIRTDAPALLHALTLVDTRTGDFVQLAPEDWPRVLSSDIKLYENQAVLPRAFVVHEAHILPDHDMGTENALQMMQAQHFDPEQTVILNTSVTPATLTANTGQAGESQATITYYTAERVEIDVEAAVPGYLLLTDAFYPGWQASVNATPEAIYRADVMFRAVQVPAGRSTVIFDYRPFWRSALLPLGIGLWLVWGIVTAGIWGYKKRWQVSAASVRSD